MYHEDEQPRGSLCPFPWWWACWPHTPFFPVALQFEGQEIALDSRMGIFITMNPGYAGRTELPESVKALFRPVVVIVPDLQQICEIMLFSEGFLWAKVMSCWSPAQPSWDPTLPLLSGWDLGSLHSVWLNCVCVCLCVF